MSWMGIDPGKSGAVAVLYGNGSVAWCRNSMTEHEIAEFVRQWSIVQAVIEKVQAMPEKLRGRRQGLSSTFKFGQSYGFLRGLLVACAVPFEDVSPAKWQGDMRCRSGGDKNVTKAAAQRLFPNQKITHVNADAILLAEYAKRIWHERNTR